MRRIMLGIAATFFKETYMKYKFQFEDDNFHVGECYFCPLGYLDDNFDTHCVLLCSAVDCPLEEVDDN